jgi:hypothetical protein
MENNNTVPCPACQKENSPSNTFCLECGERIIPLGADGAFVPSAEKETAETPATPPWHEPSENPYANAAAVAAAPVAPAGANPYSSNEPSQSVANAGGAAGTYSAPPSYQRTAGSANATQRSGEPKGLAIASLVCGIASLVCCCLNIPIAIGGLITGIVVLTKKKNGRGMAIAGVVLSAVALLIYAIMYIAVFYFMSVNSLDYTDIYREFRF